MAGPDTWRGIAFQSAYTVSRALDVLEGQLGSSLAMETGHDIVDYSSFDDAGAAVLLGQAKTRIEPYTWAPRELTAVIRRLKEVPGASGARLEFVTDGSLSHDSAEKLIPALDRVRDGQATAEDWAYLGDYGLGEADEAILAAVQIITRHDSPGAILDRAVRRIRALRDLASPVTDDEAELLVHQLHRQIEERGSRAKEDQRTLTREEIGVIVGVDPDVIDAARPWSADLAEEYRASILASPPAASIVELDAELIDVTPAALELTVEAVVGDVEARRAVLDLLDGDCSIIGPAGAGKTRSLELLRQRAAREGLVPVLLRPKTYEAGSLESLVRSAVGRQLGAVLAPGVGSTLVARVDTVVLIDGIAELPTPDMRRAVARDLEQVRSRTPAPTVIVSGRSAAAMRPLDLPAWRLVRLDRERRRAIAAELFDEAIAGPLVATIERSLEDAVDNPLLFVMALSLAAKDVPVETVGAVYAGFAEGLRARAEEVVDWEAALTAIGAVCVQMVEEERFSLDRWRWLTAVEERVEELRVRGLIADITAVDVVEALIRVGLFVSDDDATTLSFLHDSFRDWLASTGILNGTIEIPTAFATQWGAVAAHLAEAGRTDALFVNACIADATVAARAAQRETLGAVAELDQIATNAFRMLLRSHLGIGRERWESMRVITSKGETGMRALVVPDGTPDADADDAALAGANLPSGSGPLRVAVTLFLERLRRSLPRGPWQPVQIPDDSTQLAQAIESYFATQRDALAHLTSQLVPSLADRVLAQAGWRGLRGRVSEPVEDAHGSHHPFAYTYDSTDILVDTGDDRLPGASHRTAAEDYLRGAPDQKAAEALAKALESLLPGLGP
jgi:hypothetical protein